MSNVWGVLIMCSYYGGGGGGGVYCGTSLAGGWMEAWLPDFAEWICLIPLDGFLCSKLYGIV